jgi:phosphoribosylformimino-5-aminoimidazole carboxamide ribotide isomerase
MLIIPAIDLRQGHCVRLTQGRKDSAKIYDDDAVRVARAFAAEGAQMLHVVDLDAAFSEDNKRNRAVLREVIRAVNIPVQFGGGLRSLDQVKQVIDLGVTRVVVGTLAIEAPEVLGKLLQMFGSKHIAIGIDAKDGQVVVHGWETKAPISAVGLARKVAAMGAERVIYTDVARDGTLSGPNLKQTSLIAETGLKVTASGGVASLKDLHDFSSLSGSGIDSIIIGKALYEARFTLKEALNAVEVNRPTRH